MVAPAASRATTSEVGGGIRIWIQLHAGAQPSIRPSPHGRGHAPASSMSVVAGSGAARRPPSSAHRWATAVMTAARSGRSGWPDGVPCSLNRSDVNSTRSVSPSPLVCRATAKTPSPVSPVRPPWPAHRVDNSMSDRSNAARRSSMTGSSAPAGTGDRRPDGDGNSAEWARHLSLVPTAGCPAPVRFDVKRENRAAGQAGKPDGARLDGSQRTTRAIDGEGRRLTALDVPTELGQRSRAAARRRPPSRPIAKPLDDPRDPLTVEILAGHHHDATTPPEVGGDRIRPCQKAKIGGAPAAANGLVVLVTRSPATGRSWPTRRSAGNPASR